MNSEIADLFWTQCWQLTALIVLVALLGMTIGRRRPHLLYVLWVIVFVKSLTLPLWSSPTSVFSWLEPRRTPTVIDFGYLAPAPSPFAIEASDQPASASATAVIAAAPTRPWSLYDLIPVAIGIWSIGVVALLAYAVCRWLEVYRLLKRKSHTADPDLEQYAQQLAHRLGMNRRVRVLVSETNLGPLVFGTYRPVLILPVALTSKESSKQSIKRLEPIIVHELLHARRGDTTFGALQFLSQIVWWFHPLVWWASRQANRISERCCDEEVLANLDCRPSEYAGCLLDALELRASLSPTPALPGIRPVDITLDRIENIMKRTKPFGQGRPRQYWLAAIIFALLVLPGGGMLVQAWDDPPKDLASETATDLQAIAKQAERAVIAKNWQLAAEKFQAIVDQDNSHPRAWFMLGYSLHAAGQLDEAIAAHQRAATFDRVRPVALYNLACAYALRDDRAAALDALAKAINAGFQSAKPISDDPDLQSLKDDPEFIKLAASAQLDHDVYRQFDFWIGEWDVFDCDGQRVGRNVITKDEKGFLLTEKWTNSNGGTGTSINYYDPRERQWKQTWVDAGGNVVQYCGGWSKGKMILTGHLTNPNGMVVDSRVSYSVNTDGSVRQLVERSSDEGRSWRVYFDGKYVPHSAEDDEATTGAS